MTVIRPGGQVNVAGQAYSREDLTLHALQSRVESGQRIATPEIKRRLAPVRPLHELSDAERMQKFFATMRQGGLPNLGPLLPIMFNLSGEPYTLNDHFPFGPMFRTRLPQRQTLKTGRQVSKSTTLASQGIARSITIPYFNTLYVTPLFEMVRRFSSLYVRNFIQESPIRDMMVDASCSQNVLQRTFINRSTMFFSFAMLDANRVRGINASAVSIDEAQDMDPEHLPVIMETLSGSKWGWQLFAGTPKTLAGTLEGRWQLSSQAQWHIRCLACNFENIPSLEHHIDKMTGPSLVTREVSEATPGVVCAKCQRPVQPRLNGYWVHHFPERREEFAGYHVPQHVMPMHYANPIKWATLIGKRDNEVPYVYYNEVCGESFDAGARLVTQTDLKQASSKRPNTVEEALKHVGSCVDRVMSVDWGGGGKEQVSFTVITVVGLTGDGRIVTLFGERLRITHNALAEAQRVLELAILMRCRYIAHDWTGAGDLREQILVQAGFPQDQLIPIAYIRAGRGPIMRYVPPNEELGTRGHYQVDKARSLVMICELIKQKRMEFFEYDFVSTDKPGLLHDFLSLVEDRVESRTGSDLYTIIRDELAGPDDFAQAVNIGACALFYRANRWPDMRILRNLELTPEMLAAVSPQSAAAWDE
jgi:hypothetical protein